MIRRSLAGAAVTAVIVLAACSAPVGRYSGTVQTESVTVGSEVGGRVVAVDVAAGSRVRAGSAIVRLDGAQLRAEYAQALAQRAQALAALVQFEHGTVATEREQAREQSAAAAAAYRQSVAAAAQRERAARAAIADARASVTLAQRDYRRERALAASGDIARQSLDRARAARDQALARLTQARAAEVQLREAQLPGETASARANALAARAGYRTLENGTRPETIAQAKAALQAADAAAARARARLREATITAPTAGVIASFDLHPGDMLAAYQPAAIIDTFADPYTYIYASQRDLARVRAARTLRVRSDAGLGTFTGHVESYDRSAQFTPQNTETADTRADLVYGVKVRIHDPHHVLLDGTTVTVEVP